MLANNTFFQTHCISAGIEMHRSNDPLQSRVAIDKALLLVAHGSRRAQSNVEVQQVAEDFQHKDSTSSMTVAVAFLELAQPSIEAAIDQLVCDGIKHITIIPYFLAQGVHVVKDVPGIIDVKRRQYPQCRFDITAHIGSSEFIGSALEKLVQNTPC